jgi:hypothetical protein
MRKRRSYSTKNWTDQARRAAQIAGEQRWYLSELGLSSSSLLAQQLLFLPSLVTGRLGLADLRFLVSVAGDVARADVS